MNHDCKLKNFPQKFSLFVLQKNLDDERCLRKALKVADFHFCRLHHL